MVKYATNEKMNGWAEDDDLSSINNIINRSNGISSITESNPIFDISAYLKAQDSSLDTAKDLAAARRYVGAALVEYNHTVSVNSSIASRAGFYPLSLEQIESTCLSNSLSSGGRIGYSIKNDA